MKHVPDPQDAFVYEEGFLLTCKPTRIAKILALYEAYKKASEVPGALVECGVFKGTSFSIWAMLRSLLENVWMRKLIAFDTFDTFAQTENQHDNQIRTYIEKVAGIECITTEQLTQFLAQKGGGVEENCELVSGDICQTVPAYLALHPELRISLLSIDVDFDKPTETILADLFPRVVRGGIVLFDDYGTFPGASRVIDVFLKNSGYTLKHFGFTRHPCYLLKEA